jgi:hypothetical protein
MRFFRPGAPFYPFYQQQNNDRGKQDDGCDNRNRRFE